MSLNKRRNGIRAIDKLKGDSASGAPASLRSNRYYGDNSSNTFEESTIIMPNTLTAKGQVTIPKHIRDSLGLVPGGKVEFVLNESGDVVVRKAEVVTTKMKTVPNRFELARGRAEIKWRTADLMKLLRPED